MNITELTKEQKSEPKITYLQELLDEAGENRNPSMEKWQKLIVLFQMKIFLNGTKI